MGSQPPLPRDSRLAFSEQGVALCREKLWNASLFKRTWDHFRAKLG